MTELVASNAAANNAFGDRVAMSTDGMLIAASAPGEAQNAGAVYTFGLAGAWMQTASLAAAMPDTGDKLDYVAVGGGAVVAGAAFEDSSATGIGGNQADNAAMDSGAVYVFE